MTPQRIQRKRTKGWKMPENTAYVGRPTKWGNPFIVGVNGTAQECVNQYISALMPYTHHGKRNSLADFFVSEAFLTDTQLELHGKNLACWCALNQPCHADFLLEIANGGSHE